jgi:Outer membrane protein beta-barrel domain
MKRLLLPFLLGMCVFAQAQIKNFSVHAGTNYPLIRENRETPKSPAVQVPTASGGSTVITNIGVLVEKFEEKAGFNLGTSFQVFESKKFFIETGASANYYRYKKSTTIESLSKQSSTLVLGSGGGSTVVGTVGSPFPLLPTTSYNRDNDGRIIVDQNGNPVTHANSEFPKPAEDLGKTSTVYLQVPIVFGKSFLNDKLIAKIGLSTNFLVYASEYKQDLSYTTNALIKDTSKDGFSRAMINGTFQATYLITKNIGIDLSYQRSLNSIYSEQAIDKSYYNIFSLGASYHFSSKKNVNP